MQRIASLRRLGVGTEFQKSLVAGVGVQPSSSNITDIATAQPDLDEVPSDEDED